MAARQIFFPDSPHELQILKKQQNLEFLRISYYPAVGFSKHACGRILLLVGVSKCYKDFFCLKMQHKGILLVEPSQLVLVPCLLFIKPLIPEADGWIGADPASSSEMKDKTAALVHGQPQLGSGQLFEAKENRLIGPPRVTPRPLPNFK